MLPVIDLTANSDTIRQRLHPAGTCGEFTYTWVYANNEWRLFYHSQVPIGDPSWAFTIPIEQVAPLVTALPRSEWAPPAQFPFVDQNSDVFWIENGVLQGYANCYRSDASALYAGSLSAPDTVFVETDVDGYRWMQPATPGAVPLLLRGKCLFRGWLTYKDAELVAKALPDAWVPPAADLDDLGVTLEHGVFYDADSHDPVDEVFGPDLAPLFAHLR